VVSEQTPKTTKPPEQEEPQETVLQPTNIPKVSSRMTGLKIQHAFTQLRSKKKKKKKKKSI
jgi:hypothetical protein